MGPKGGSGPTEEDYLSVINLTILLVVQNIQPRMVQCLNTI